MTFQKRYISVATVRLANARLMAGEKVNLPAEVRRHLPGRESLAEAGRRAMEASRDRQSGKTAASE